MSAKVFQQIADLADSIGATCEEIADAFATWDDPEGETAIERRESRDDAAERISVALGELLAEADKLRGLG